MASSSVFCDSSSCTSMASAIVSFLLGNEVIKNTGASSEMIGAGYSMAESWDLSLIHI